MNFLKSSLNQFFLKLIPKFEVYIEGKAYVVEEFILKKMYCLPFIKKNEFTSWLHGQYIYDNGEDVVCCISDKNEMEKIISSLILYL